MEQSKAPAHRGGTLRFAIHAPVSPEQFRDVLQRSTLAQRRPVEDFACLQGMTQNSNLMATCWDGDLLVGIARSVTDFHYCCYLSDLAVDVAYQRRGVGRRLIDITRDALGPRCTIILLAAPAAVDYYPRLGFERHPQAWILRPGRSMRSQSDTTGSSPQSHEAKS